MKEFIMIFMGASYEELGLSPEQIQERMGRWFAWSEKMNSKGIEHKGHALNPTGRSISGPDKVITDGPFLEGKEIIGGYYVVKANNYEEVVEIAKDFPEFDLGGTVEIREIMVFDN